MTTGEKLKSQLTELSRNLWWAWNPHIIKLFRDLDAEALTALREHDWPGNVRELFNVIQRCALNAEGLTITRENVLGHIRR